MASASSLLTMEERGHPEALLYQNTDILVWTHSDMLGIDHLWLLIN